MYNPSGLWEKTHPPPLWILREKKPNLPDESPNNANETVAKKLVFAREANWHPEPVRGGKKGLLGHTQLENQKKKPNKPKKPRTPPLSLTGCAIAQKGKKHAIKKLR